MKINVLSDVNIDQCEAPKAENYKMGDCFVVFSKQFKKNKQYVIGCEGKKFHVLSGIRNEFEPQVESLCFDYDLIYDWLKR